MEGKGGQFLKKENIPCAQEKNNVQIIDDKVCKINDQ